MKKTSLWLFMAASAAALRLGALTPTDYARSLEFTVSGYTGAASVADFSALVRLSTAIAGFSYDDFQLADGGDLRFIDEYGNLIPHEIDTWNPEGESLVWVRMPTLAAGRKITAYYGNATPDALPDTDFWSNYLGVWHFNSITSGVTPDATANALDLTAKDTSVQTVREGVVGNSVITSWAWGKQAGGFKSADYRSKLSSDAFTISGWFYHNLNVGDGKFERLFAAKSSADASDGFDMRMEKKNNSAARALGSTSAYVSVPMPNVSNLWTKVTVVYDGTTATVYTNGFVSASGTVAAATHTWKGFAVGNGTSLNDFAWRGSVDEVRFATSAQSADRIRAEWETETKADFFTASDVQAVDATQIIFDAPDVSVANGRLVVTAKLAAGEGAVHVAYGPSRPFATTNLVTTSIAAPNGCTLALTGLADDTSYLYSVLGVNANGTWTERRGEGCFLNGEVSLAKGADASEWHVETPATVVVSRPSGAGTAGDLVVSYTVGGTAVAGTHYRALPGSVTIPDGAASAAIEIWPLLAQDGDHTVVVTLASGAYFIAASAASATVTLEGIAYPEGFNTWTGEAGDGLASSAANWSGGVPTAADKINLDGRFSSTDLTWDAGVNGLPATVASWTQDASYEGAVTFTTGYEGANAQFAIMGDAVVNGGSWTHPTNTADGVQVSRLDVAVGGSFTLGAAAKLDAKGRGFANGKYREGSGYACHATSPRGMTGQVYGSVTAPVDVGCGGRSDSYSCGGGAVRLVVAGAATIDGAIDARSSSQSPRTSEKNNGAGGSVFVTAASISGAGTVDASAYASDGSESCQQEGASGGRIALVATAGEVTIPLANLKANGATGGSVEGAAATGGGGTIYVKNAADANGALLVGTTGGKTWSYVKRYPTPTSTTIVPPGETWTFDRVYLRGQGILSVPSGATLALPNGFKSVSNTDASEAAYSCGILYLGGTIRVPALAEPEEHVLSGGWIFEAIEPFAFAGDVRLQDNAGFGCFYLTQPTVTNTLQCQVSVGGSLTVESDGVLYGKTRGQRNTASIHVAATHGGVTSFDPAGSNAYDSVFHPRYSGACGQGAGGKATDPGTQNVGGGALKLTVGGVLTMDGKADFSGAANETGCNASAGGSLDITAGSLAGAGSILADGSSASGSGARASGGGGRIAIRLTDSGATFSDDWLDRISATGGKRKESAGCDASAGTVYLQDGSQADGAGAIVVANSNRTSVEVPTVLPASGWGADAAGAFKLATLKVEKAGIVQLSENLTLAGASVAAETNGKIDLGGRCLKVATLVVDGAKVARGTYRAGDAALGDAFLDSSDGASGTVVVGAIGLILIIR